MSHSQRNEEEKIVEVFEEEVGQASGVALITEEVNLESDLEEEVEATSRHHCK